MLVVRRSDVSDHKISADMSSWAKDEGVGLVIDDFLDDALLSTLFERAVHRLGVGELSDPSLLVDKGVTLGADFVRDTVPPRYSR